MAELKLCKGVELEPNYEHTFDFANATEQGEYFATKVYKTYDNFLLIKDRNASLFKGIIAKENYDYLKVPETLDNVRECTYLFWNNGGLNDKTYYAFITNSYYLNENTTIIEYELDVMQTFLFDYQIESAYIAREHQDRLETTSTSHIDRNYKAKFNIMPENLNIGQDVIINGNQKLCKFATFTEGGKTVKRPMVWIIVIAKNSLLDVDPVISPFYTSSYKMNNNMHIYAFPYIIGKPFKSTSDYLTNIVQVDVAGTPVELWTYNAFIYFNTIKIGGTGKLDNIHQIIVTSYLPNYDGITINSSNVLSFDTNSKKLWTVQSLEWNNITKNVLQLYEQADYDETNHDTTLGQISDIKDVVNFTPSITLEPSIRFETKLNTYPYSYIQMSHNNKSVEIKYENIKSKYIDARINIYGAFSFLIYNRNYAMKENINTDNDNLGYNYGIATQTINDIPLTSDAYLTYMLTRSAQAVTGVAVKGMAGVTSAILGGIAVANASNPLGAVAGFGALVGGITTAGSAIAEEVAKREDLKNTPPNLENMSNDGTFSTESKTIIPILQYMEIKDEYKQQCYSYFRLFGYKANRLATPTYDGNGTIVSDNMNLKSRYYFNYIKCADINIELGYNRDYHDKIISIFKNGITFWHYRTGMGYNNFKPFNYRYENIEMSLL